MRKACIDKTLFQMAFERDVVYADTYPLITWLDLEIGEVLWVYECDGDAAFNAGIEEGENRALRLAVEARPERYLEIPGLTHGEHHEVLQAFLRSDWTDDEALWSKAAKAYWGSIGGWKEAVRDEAEILDAWYDFKERELDRMMTEFLHDHGIDPEWR